MELFTSLEIMIMVSVIGFLGFLIAILTIIEIVCNRKSKKDINNIEVTEVKEDKVSEETFEEEDDDIDIANIDITKPFEVIKESIIKKEAKPFEVLEAKEDVDNVEVQETVEVKKDTDEILIEDIDEPTFIKEEKVEQVLEVKKIEPIEVLELEPLEHAKIELEKIEESLINPPSLEDTITTLEAQEEENAIISYQELLSVTKEMSVVNIEDEGNEPISISEVMEQFNMNSDLDEIKIDEIVPDTPLDAENLNEIQLENTANLEKLDKEIRKTNKFLNILNELKKNLD